MLKQIHTKTQTAGLPQRRGDFQFHFPFPFHLILLRTKKRFLMTGMDLFALDIDDFNEDHEDPEEYEGMRESRGR